MIWIHGGALIVGSSVVRGWSWTHGTMLAGDQDIVVASIQYRLGPLGFLYFGTEDAPGNMGLIDQNSGIQWIHDNIASFGGNKEKITLFGVSAGSLSISYHLLSPLSQNLFKRTILMSGAATAPLLKRTQEESIQFSYEVAEHAGCFSQTDDPSKSINEIMSCMRTKDTFVLNFASYPCKFFMDFTASLTVDNFLPDTPENLLNSSPNSLADIIIGTVQDEGTVFLLYSYPQFFTRLEHPSLSIKEYEALFRKTLPNRPDFETEAIITRYTHWSNFNDGKQNALNLMAAVGDYLYVCPGVKFAQKWSNNGRKVYFYWFTHRPSEPNPSWLGVFHGSDVEYTFGGPILDASRPEHEKNLSWKIQELFENFAKTGIPSENWLDFTAARPVYLDLNATVTSGVTPDNIYGPRGDECAFWNIELPRLRKLAENNDGGGESCPNDANVLSIQFAYLFITIYVCIHYFQNQVYS